MGLVGVFCLHAQKAGSSAALEAASSSTQGSGWALSAARRALRKYGRRAGALGRCLGGPFYHAALPSSAISMSVSTSERRRNLVRVSTRARG